VFGQSFGSRSLPLVSKGKLYSTLVLNLLLYGCENWVLTAPLRQRLNAFHNRCVCAMSIRNAPPSPALTITLLPSSSVLLSRQCTPPSASRASTRSSPNRKLRWAGHVRRMDWSRLPRKFLTLWVDAPRCRGRAHSCVLDLVRELQLIGFNTDRAAVQLGVSLSWGAVTQDREKWRKLAARLLLAPVTGMVWYGAPPTPWTAIVATRWWQLELSMLRLSPFRPRLYHTMPPYRTVRKQVFGSHKCFNLPRICAICSSAMKGLAYAGAYASAYEGSESICGPK
jgi:hypothetical protein